MLSLIKQMHKHKKKSKLNGKITICYYTNAYTILKKIKEENIQI